MKSVIYETKGRAKEFNELAVNLFTGCGHQCIYCYGADITHQSKDDFENRPRERVTISDIIQSARMWKARGETRRVLLCFVTDPYQPIEAETQLTRQAIIALHSVGLNVIILTKGGLRSMRDFDLLTPQDAYATTLTIDNPADSLKWEPHAALPAERIDALRQAHNRGIETWVSFEPTIYPEQTKQLFLATKDIVGHYKVGTINYHPQGKSINWFKHGWEMKRLLDSYGAKYYFKNDLLKEMKVIPAEFKQTWVCN